MRTISEMWHDTDDAGKIEMLKTALRKQIPFHEDLLRDTVNNIDRLAKPLGFKPVYITVVDMAGMRDISCGVVSPEIESKHSKRNWR